MRFLELATISPQRLVVAIFACYLAVIQPMSLAAEREESKVDFSRDVRPVLSDTCFLCHGPAEETRAADLRLDKRDDAIAAGAIDPDDWQRSEVLARIFSDDPEIMMPPPDSGKQLSKPQKETLERWIRQGAEYAEHWAFVVPERPEVPEVESLMHGRGGEWVQNPIDAFVQSRMQEHGLEPSPQASHETLIRRLHLDLTGLPPSPNELDDVTRQNWQDAYPGLVRSLLQSPHYGEKWARWWLDAARYADSDGYEKDKPRTVWFYRDWVLQAFQQDLPYDQFVVQQIAGDLLPQAGQDERVATGFLRNSMVNEEGGADPEQFRVEGMFDRVDAIGKAILGITTQCAQCHTHKYDPLSQTEYYQMFAALNDFEEATISVFTPQQMELKASIEESVSELEERLRKDTPDWEARMLEWADAAREQLVEWKTVVPTERPFEGEKFRPLEDGSILSESYAPTRANNSFSLEVEPQTITAFRLDLLTHPQLPRGGPGRSVFGTGALTEFEVEIEARSAPESSAPESSTPDTKRKVKFQHAIADVHAPRSSLLPIYRDRDPDKDDRVTGPIEYAIDGDHKTAWTTDSGAHDRNQDRYAVFFPEQPVEISVPSKLTFTLRQLHGGWNSDDNQNYLLGRYRFAVSHQAQDIEREAVPVSVQRILLKPKQDWSNQEREHLFHHWRQTVPDFAEVNAQIESLWERFPETESQLVVQQRENPRETFVMLRGDFLSPGAKVEAGTPEFLNPMPRGDEPPRLRFARWLVSEQSPTAARVVVNRIWQAYFGRGLVETPEDFGFQSMPPTHPELLDWLAVELMEHNWSLKHIHRLIVGSATYQQSSNVDGWLLSRDPSNQWYARGPRFRVDAELVRDIALTVSGLLNAKVGGPSVYPPAPEFLFQPPASYGPKIWDTSKGDEAYRRGLYVHQYRSVPYPALQVFDAPKGDGACVRRTRSNTPLQALVLLNEPQFMDCARGMATRVLREAEADDNTRLQYAHRLCTSRWASAEELEILQQLLQTQREHLANSQVDVEGLVGTSESVYRQLTGKAAREFAPWILVCRVLLNLDETITKE
ncbi:MAG: PSD1 and planctomycete cytochrome C domain-containing protein [bacterium]|nr:PSD1 and planctomycete cytochrome C domain-containing protein [bacterium]